MKASIIDFPIVSDKRGVLVALEQFKDVPFEIKRVYYIYGTNQNEARGFHAHIDLQQLLICVSGSCKITVDNVKEKKEYELNRPNQGLLIDGLIWREVHEFSADCVLVVLASNYYDERDYIRSYEDFLIEVNQRVTR